MEVEDSLNLPTSGQCEAINHCLTVLVTSKPCFSDLALSPDWPQGCQFSVLPSAPYPPVAHDLHSAVFTQVLPAQSSYIQETRAVGREGGSWASGFNKKKNNFIVGYYCRWPALDKTGLGAGCLFPLCTECDLPLCADAHAAGYQIPSACVPRALQG